MLKFEETFFLNLAVSCHSDGDQAAFSISLRILAQI